MAYYIMGERKRGEFISLDITHDELFTRFSRFTSNACSLEEIDNFTVNFVDGEDLRRYLYKQGILVSELCDKPLSIRTFYNSKNSRRVMYDFLYQKDKKYLDNPKLLIDDINYRLLTKDFRFVLEYANHFFNYYDSYDITPEIRAFSKDSLDFGYTNRHFAERDENGDTPIVRMTKQLIYEYDHRDYGRITYYKGIKYRNLHDIIAFCDNYDKKILNEKEKKETKVKTKVLKKDDQITFWD